jgi:acetyl esterase/lipase
MIPTVFLAVSLVGAAFTLSTLVRGRRLYVLAMPYFFASWLAGELAFHHIAWQAVATLVFVALGALDRWPGVLGLTVTLCSWAGLLVFQRDARAAGPVLEAALCEALGPRYRDRIPEARRATFRGGIRARELLHPFRMRRAGVERIRDIAYGEAGSRQMLDIYRPAGASARSPVLLQIHGGAWVIGDKEQQALPLMHHLASCGWVCIAANYRLSPRATFPDHLVDVKRALAWVRAHGPEWGADPDCVVITGGSAGAHLSTLAALTANDAEWQPGFESADTSVAACVAFYGVYDFLDRQGVRGGEALSPFLRRTVMKCSPEEAPERWERASPIAHVHEDAPPFLVIHGTHDSLAFVEEARGFARALRAVSRNPVVYAELAGAQHAFELFHSVRSWHTVDAVHRFVEYVHAQRRAASRGRLAPADAVGRPARRALDFSA